MVAGRAAEQHRFGGERRHRQACQCLAADRDEGGVEHAAADLRDDKAAVRIAVRAPTRQPAAWPTPAGAGVRGSLAAAAATAAPQSRAEVIAGYFLGAYAGLSIPVIGLGIADQYAPARDVMLVFVVLAALAIAASTRAVLRHHGDRQGART
jgi:hypothetical protein